MKETSMPSIIHAVIIAVLFIPALIFFHNMWAAEVALRSGLINQEMLQQYFAQQFAIMILCIGGPIIIALMCVPLFKAILANNDRTPKR
jgi:hypothetical protein